MKNAIFWLGDRMCEVGERTGLRFLVYNPITWARFFVSGRRSGSIFSRALSELFPDVKSAIDVGAGTGGYVAGLSKAGLKAAGLEYSAVGRTLAKLQGADVKWFDCSTEKGMPDLPKVDLAYSIEVGEHLPEELAPVLVKYICKRADLVVFSAAFPGQGGQGHVNEQPQDYWRKMFEVCGFEFMEAKTKLLASKLEDFEFRGWLPRNVQVFSRRY